MTAFCLIIVECLDKAGLEPRIKQCDAMAAALLGYPPDTLVGKPLRLVCAGDTAPIMQSALAMTASQPLAFELLTQNQTRLQVSITASVLLAHSPCQRDIALFIQLSSPNQEADGANCGPYQLIESALIESEARFRQMADMAGEWLWEQTSDGHYIYCSAAVQQILGYSPEEVTGKHYTRFLTESDKLAKAKDTSHKPFYALLNNYRHKDGHLVVTESTGFPLFDSQGHLYKWRGVDRDITAKKYFQDALIASERRTRLIIESSTNAIVIIDSAGIITDWNLQAAKIFGWSNAEAVGQALVTLIVPERLRAGFSQGLKLFLNTGICHWFDTLLEQNALRRDGSEFPIELSVSPLLMGGRYSFSGFIRDISTRKVAEQQIREAQITMAIAQSELKIAQRIQTSLLPSAPILTSDFTVTGLCLPADKIGGDYFDYFYHNKNHLDMVVADVSGHSIGPALFMIEARSVIRTQASHSGKPAAILGLLNHFLFEDLNQADYFITAFYLQYDINRSQLSYANAGHLPPLLLRSGAKSCEELDADGMILGVRRSIDFEEKKLLMAKGDMVLLYTDGLTEADNDQGEFFGLPRVHDVLLQHAGQDPQAILSALVNALKGFCRKESFTDDITLLLFKRH